MKNCPICNKPLETTEWYQEEKITQCPSGCYLDHWKHGLQILKLGKWEVAFADHDYMDARETEIAKTFWKEFLVRAGVLEKLRNKISKKVRKRINNR